MKTPWSLLPGLAHLGHEWIKLTCVSSLQDFTVIVWDMKAPHDIVVRRTLRGHIAAVTAVRFDERFIVSGSKDNTINVRRQFPIGDFCVPCIACRCGVHRLGNWCTH